MNVSQYTHTYLGVKVFCRVPVERAVIFFDVVLALGLVLLVANESVEKETDLDGVTGLV